MLAKDNSVKKWSVAPRGLTVCHVIFAWLNNYNIKPYENKEAKKSCATTAVAQSLITKFIIKFIIKLIIYRANLYKKSHKLYATYGIMFCQMINHISNI